MRKSVLCICENKGAEQLRGNCAAELHLCLHYIDSTIHLLSKSEFQSSNRLLLLAWFVAYLVRNPTDRSSDGAAHF